MNQYSDELCRRLYVTHVRVCLLDTRPLCVEIKQYFGKSSDAVAPLAAAAFAERLPQLPVLIRAAVNPKHMLALSPRKEIPGRIGPSPRKLVCSGFTRGPPPRGHLRELTGEDCGGDAAVQLQLNRTTDFRAEALVRSNPLADWLNTLSLSCWLRWLDSARSVSQDPCALVSEAHCMPMGLVSLSVWCPSSR